MPNGFSQIILTLPHQSRPRLDDRSDSFLDQLREPLAILGTAHDKAAAQALCQPPAIFDVDLIREVGLRADD